MILKKDVADITGFDISTISRVVKSKYADIHQMELFCLKIYSQIHWTNDDGEEVSTKEIKTTSRSHQSRRQEKTIDRRCFGRCFEKKRIILPEEPSLKYREQLNIPVARLRKEL